MNEECILVRDLGPSLIAAVSLLENGGKAAVASDKMFEQMLKDYRGSIKRTREALQEKKVHLPHLPARPSLNQLEEWTAAWRAALQEKN